SAIAAKAAGEALRRRGIGADELEIIIVATVTPDMLFPATGCLVQDRIGAKRAWAFDVSAACSGFAYALTIGAQFIETGRHSKVMVIGADVMTSILDFEDRTTCVLFGDAAGAVILERNGLSGNDVDLFVAHQANIRIIEAAQQRMGLPDSKVIKNIREYGNT